MTETLQRTDAALSSYAVLGESSIRNSQGALRALRAKALERFLQVGFPTTRQEEWRYTNTAALARTEFELAQSSPLPAEEEIADFTLEGTDRFVFVDGRFAPTLSASPSNPGVKISSLLANDDAAALAHLGAHANVEANPFTALNSALFQDGTLIRIEEGSIVERPLHLLFLSTAGNRPTMNHPRVLVVAEKSSEARIVESFATLGDGVCWTNSVTEIALGENARIEHYKLQEESEQAFHTATIQAQQVRDSRFVSHSLSFGAALARNDIGVTLLGEGSSCSLNGLYFARGTQHVDHHTVIDHATPHSDSQELYKGIMDDSGRGVFDGKIVVRKDAQKTNSGQVNKNLLLSRLAIADTKPQLEIYADDVKCTHGSTIGQLEEEPLFYMRTRGIGESDARTLLVYAFARELVNRVGIPSLRSHLDRVLLERLPSARLEPL